MSLKEFCQTIGANERREMKWAIAAAWRVSEQAVYSWMIGSHAPSSYMMQKYVTDYVNKTFNRQFSISELFPAER